MDFFLLGLFRQFRTNLTLFGLIQFALDNLIGHSITGEIIAEYIRPESQIELNLELAVPEL